MWNVVMVLLITPRSNKVSGGLTFSLAFLDCVFGWEYSEQGPWMEDKQRSTELVADCRSALVGGGQMWGTTGGHWYQPQPVSQMGLHVEAGHKWQQWGCAAPRTRCYDPSALDKKEYFGNLWYNLRHINKIPILKYLTLHLEFLWTLLI